MIYPLAGLILGAVLGGVRAKRKEGNGKDIAQWAAVHAMIFGVAGMFLLIFIERSMQ